MIWLALAISRRLNRYFININILLILILIFYFFIYIYIYIFSREILYNICEIFLLFVLQMADSDKAWEILFFGQSLALHVMDVMSLATLGDAVTW